MGEVFKPLTASQCKNAPSRGRALREYFVSLKIQRILIQENGTLATTRLLCLDLVLRKASVAHVNRRRRWYYLIVLLLLTIFTLACLSFEFDIVGYGAPHDA